MAKNFYDSENNLLFVGTKKHISLEDMLEQSNYIKNNTELPRDLKILEDGRLSNLNFNENDLAKIAENLYQMSENYNYIRHALVLDTPKSTAYAMIVIGAIKNPKYNLKVFSTIEAAKEWLTLL